ncbi:hypothetical protein [Myxococcus landrumensis]|uniref:Lipoprotein n=1 Tax=Myxococcus landrumensis TaxID=2813577 RepID=A0ABX7N1K9_9BACT|nr:hypothetical protein [Myxococcus landrumus]QSQ12373.1 hypothetical protein JY572_28990 [Myxococcus landrumus]
MKTHSWTTWVAMMSLAGLSLVGCGEDSLRPVRDGESPTAQPQDPTWYELRIRGVRAQGYTAALLGIESMSATADGQPIEVRLRANHINLADTEHAHLVGYFFMPEGASDVRLSVRLGAFGGFEHESGAGMIDARTGPITLDTKVESLRRNGRATVLLDVEKSLTPERHGRRLLPRTRLVY